MTPNFTHKSYGDNGVNMKGEPIVQVHYGTYKSIFQGATKAWIGFIGACKRFGRWWKYEVKMEQKSKLISLAFPFHGLFQHKTMGSNIRALFENPQSTKPSPLSCFKMREETKKLKMLLRTEKLCSASGLLVYICLIVYCMSAWMNGGRDGKGERSTSSFQLNLG